jgi:hypothetical protein
MKALRATSTALPAPASVAVASDAANCAHPVICISSKKS